MRLRFTYSRGAPLRYLSHLDLVRLFYRALRRSGLPLEFTRGFNPRPRLSLAAPLPLGVTASREYGDLFLAAPVSPEIFMRSFSAQLPAGLELTGAAPAGPREPLAAALVNAALYRAAWSGAGRPPAMPDLRAALARLLAAPAIMVQRRGKDGKAAAIDIRPFIFQAEPAADNEPGPALSLLLQVGSRGGVSPFLVLRQLDPAGGAAEQSWRLHRAGLYVYDHAQKKFSIPFAEGGEM